MTENTNNSLAASVRQADYERYIAALFAPAERREALFALIAFNHELARIADVVSEPMLGEIRLQWWREAIEAIYAGTPVRKHEVTQPLAQAIAQFTIPRAPLDLMIDTRAFDLAGEPPSDMAALEAYAEGTAGALNEAMMAVLGSRKAEALAAARHAGTAWALIGLMRAAPMHAARGRVFLPQAMLGDAGIARSDVLAGDAWQALAVPVVAAISKRAGERLVQARAARRQLTRLEKKALLIARLGDTHLHRLKSINYDLSAPERAQTTLGPLLKLSFAALQGRY